jgi:hypothetical protein
MEQKTSSCCDLLAVQDGRRQAEEGGKKKVGRPRALNGQVTLLQLGQRDVHCSW